MMSAGIKRLVLMMVVCCGYMSNGIADQMNDNAMVNDIVRYVNQYRIQHGLSPLSLNTVLSKAAAQHSLDMAQHKVSFGHDGFEQRMTYARQHIANGQGGAENVAYNYKTAKIVVDGWINSSGHRHNILGHYDLTGVGIVRDKLGKPYFTQLFLKA